MEISDAWIALIGTLFGGVLLEIVRKWLSNRKDKDDTAASLRAELRTEIDNLRRELKEEAAGHDNFREKYWVLYEQNVALKSELDVANATLRANGLPPTRQKPLSEVIDEAGL